MLNPKNYQYANREMRVNALKRALYTQPFFAVLPYIVVSGAEKTRQYDAKLEVNKDFYLTEIQTNLGEVFTTTGTTFNLSVYTGYQRSVYRFDAQQPLPSPFISYEARFNTPLNNLVFDDRQREIQSFLIRNGDKVNAILESVDTKAEDATVYVCLKGFQMVEQPFIDTRTLAMFETALDKAPRIEYFKATIDRQGNSNYLIENDGIPRLILGFGCRNSTPEKGLVSASSIRILDQSRSLQFNADLIPVEFFAPRLTCLLDTHIYYLPIEYYWQPYSRLQLDVTNVSPNQELPQGYEFVVMTVTI